MTPAWHIARLEAEHAVLGEQVTAPSGALDQVDARWCDVEPAPRTGRLSRKM